MLKNIYLSRTTGAKRSSFEATIMDDGFIQKYTFESPNDMSFAEIATVSIIEIYVAKNINPIPHLFLYYKNKLHKDKTFISDILNILKTKYPGQNYHEQFNKYLILC